ncbi:MAG: IcmK protein [Pseudomonadota bacterium]|jgi:intracellular multiplication protein IcmK
MLQDTHKSGIKLNTFFKQCAVCALLLFTKTAHAADTPNYRAQPRTSAVPSASETAVFSDPETETLAQNTLTEEGDPFANTMTGEGQKEPSASDRPVTMRDKAFRQLLNKSMPMTPEQIIDYHKELYRSQQAINTSPVSPPKPVSSTITVDLSPGMPPPVIRLAPGFVTSMVFLDATGQPWPIADYSIGNAKQFNVQWDSKKNTIFIQSTSPFTSSNLALRLAELDTPLVISLVSGQKEVDYRVDIQVNGQGPNALAPIIGNDIPQATSTHLLNVLDGIPPTGSKELVVTPALGGRAWVNGHRLLLRTKLTVLSPAWLATVSSPDGTRVYEMPKTPLVLATQDGKTIRIELRGL